MSIRTLDNDTHFTAVVAGCWPESQIAALLESGTAAAPTGSGILAEHLENDLKLRVDVDFEMLIEELDGSNPSYALPTYTT
ncbi:hypothetical protein Sme01_55810 [Sphaerisporangium melleum]|uniref:Uncharacterized protein n=1 Tax=Sphaerisporangium melleum TaxID=321316 RepID=A0A917RG52_9ACTN|nr:hypothetical protein [Sphaerisporangium melleum]GGL06218.1 hypothetical protein GCM10007964_55620 [Sphaerisporangium melleum]GII73105.1 hypothetical protein Sme01_55810 [Sphaerisporangium melleum]